MGQQTEWVLTIKPKTAAPTKKGKTGGTKQTTKPTSKRANVQSPKKTTKPAKPAAKRKAK